MSSNKKINSLINVGFKNAIAKDKVVAVVSADAAPVKRLKDIAKRENRLVDATNGRRTNTVIITVSNHVILSSAQPETIARRF